MKKILMIAAAFAIISPSQAQTECSKSNPIFRSENYGTPREVYSLGSNPEFPFLRNLSTPQQVANAMKKATNKPGMAELNNLLKDIGFVNGAKDIDAAAISADYLREGIIGNMGDGNFNSSYVKLATDNLKAWKISSASGCYVYVLAKCGNAFYPAKEIKPTASIEVPLNLYSMTKEIKVEAGETRTTTRATYVYYHKNRHRNRALSPEYAGLTDPRASTPVLLNTAKKVDAIPQTYRVTVNAPDNSVKVYEDQPLQLTANINVERTSEYTGYYTYKTNKDYREVTKRIYNKSERKMRHALRKEQKVARITGIDVTTDVPVKE